MCLQYKPNIVACVCIHLACKWSGYEIPSSHEGKSWFSYVDKNITLETLEELTQDFLNILDKCPSRLKKKIMTWRSGKGSVEDEKKSDGASTSKSGEGSKHKQETSSRNLFEDSQSFINDTRPEDPSRSQSSASSSRPSDSKYYQGQGQTSKDYKQHKDRKEKDRLPTHTGYPSSSSGGSSAKPHGNGDVKKSHHHRVDAERKATQSAFDGLHHVPRDDPKRSDSRKQHDSPLKMSKTSRDERLPKVHDHGSKAMKRSHQSDNEMSDGSERHSKHRRSETHPISNDSSFSSSSVNPGDMLSGNNFMATKMEAGNGSANNEHFIKAKSGFSDGITNKEQNSWSKSSTKSPGSVGAGRKDRSIFSPPQPPHIIQHKMGIGQPPPPPPHSIQSNPAQSANMNNSAYDKSFHGMHSSAYSYSQFMPNPNMTNNFADPSMMGAVQGMNSNGGGLQNQQEMMGDIHAQLQHLITQQKQQIAATQQAQIQTQQQSIFDMDLLDMDSDLGSMPPLPPPLPQNNVRPPPPPDF